VSASATSNEGPETFPPEHRGGTVRARKRRWRRVLLALVALLAVAWGGWWVWSRRHPVSPVEIFNGVTYACERLPDTAETGGLVHVARVDLSADGVEIWTTPLDPAPMAKYEREYYARYTADVLKSNDLAVAVNGTLFAPAPKWIFWPFPGLPVRAIETVVSDGQVNHIDPHSYLLWFDADRRPHLERGKPPRAELLAGQARWAIGAQQPIDLANPQWASIGRAPDERTALAIDSGRKLLWIAAFERASPTAVVKYFQAAGAKELVLLDGGDSTSMAIAKNGAGVRPGTLIGGWRPVATHFGVRAKPVGR